MSGPAEILFELAYRDPTAALGWLSHAFGFETRIEVSDASGQLIYAESGAHGFMVGVIPESPPALVSPAGGGSSGTVHIRFPTGGVDIDGHFARARDAGAKVLIAPRQQFYGDLEYLCADPEGHLWNFGIRDAAPPGPPPDGITVRFPSGRPQE